MSDRSLIVALAVFAGTLLNGGPGRADCVKIRPTDPGGYAGIEYGSDPVASHATPEGRVRVWYTTAGLHAPDVSGAAEIAGHAVEEAIDGYAAMGFLSALGDGDYPPCASNGGDGRLDVYLIHFAGADGTAVTEQCAAAGAAARCSGFILAESRLDKIYASFEQGAQTVLPHEYFHLVQDAYDAKMARYWAEGTAQWATKQLHPELTDLERFLPAYFTDTDRSLDAPPGGVVAAFLYATAIWPVFLSERHGAAIVREILEVEAAKGSTVLEATETALSPRGSSLATEFTLFAAWNAATGKLAGGGGYPLSMSYPMVETTDLPSTVGASVKGITSGLSAFYYRFAGDAARVVSIDADPRRNAGVAVPLVDGIARLDRIEPLPARLEGEAMIVVAGQSTLKTDAPFSLHVGAPPQDAPPQDAPPQDAPPQAAPRDDAIDTPPTAPRAAEQDAGCSIARGRAAAGSTLGGWPVIAASAAAVARRRKKRGNPEDGRRRAHDAAVKRGGEA
jgi:hypothetical protein